MPLMKRSERIRAIKAALGDHCIVFVGMMGCGKSAIGRLVAEQLSLPYFDSDAEIITASGMSIPEIFEKFGEDYFRSGEQRVVSRLLAEGPSVVSLGGGAFINDTTRAVVRGNAVSVWLKADVDLLYARVMRKPGTRPLLQTADPRATLVALLEKRAPIYALADLHVESSSHSKKATAEDTLRMLQRHLKATTQNQDNQSAETVTPLDKNEEVASE